VLPLLAALPRKTRLVLLAVCGVVALVVCVFVLVHGHVPGLAPRGPGAPAASADGYLFCFWNAENFFDDELNGYSREPDKEFDEWFARDSAALRLKIDNLSGALLKMNDGRGPDIIALAEVETERAAELLRAALNAGLKDGAAPYNAVLYKDPKGGRHIANAVITRLPVTADRTQLLGRRQRILETHVVVGGHDLVVVASHWTSRVSDQEGERRDRYADVIYGQFKGMYRSNPKVDFLVCGDFNDPPDDASVTEHLRAVGDVDRVLRGGPEPLLLNLFADKVGGREGSHYYGGKWLTFDQIAVSPGMLDREGWYCDPGTARIVNDLTADRNGRPWRFGTERSKAARGYSDHFPVSVRLKVAGGE
jgi:endonuclease/exonuclease/phosphatase family metal-dependent hydrolase